MKRSAPLQDLSPGLPPALRVIGLHKRFGLVDVVRGIDLTAETGAVISILGSSGSGKSTFLRCLNCLEIPDAGEIWLADDQVIGGPETTPSRQISFLRRRLGMVFQSFNLWEQKTVLQNVIEAPIHVRGLARREAIEQAEHWLARVGLSDKRSAYPAQLSGGQKQRVAIARALAMEPNVLLFDEPTSALDPELVGEVLRVIRGLAEDGRTMLIVTHEIGFARQVSSEVVFLHKGRIEERATPACFFAHTNSARLRQFLSSHPTEPFA
ncbi:octopine/nopaline transport system ATP-binding protein/arginine/ornithine transport system ATP-binding protein [Rhizobium sp. PP-F2F-G48]|uniref:ABC transporter ATP-binding protein n=1 Tax=Rhizobium sp. PP-F2F-G48 TaxID=2135651 RepID=UPI001049A28B|nr:ATP-binding cassette domain-containing protein [Rhizobium sp. PP-F2F-G48]TCM50675.1 octopine/nopaline transport system ATP-binding protein/arginine/ornithine transport system ATP-binding protein [Rhizobium sp. PP-F2F-G48]